MPVHNAFLWTAGVTQASSSRIFILEYNEYISIQMVEWNDQIYVM